MKNIWSIRSLMFSTWSCWRLSINHWQSLFEMAIHSICAAHKMLWLYFSFFIVPNPFGMVKFWTNKWSTKIHPENKLIKVTDGTEAHLPCVGTFVFIFQTPWISSLTFSNRKLFTDKSPLSLTSYRVILETNSCYWTKNSCFSIDLSCLWAILSLTSLTIPVEISTKYKEHR